MKKEDKDLKQGVDPRDQAEMKDKGKELNIDEQKALDLERAQELKDMERADVVISPAKMVWNNFKSRKITLIGVVIFGFILFFSIVLPIFLSEAFVSADDRYTAPNFSYWFGTDQVGRDLFYRIALGGRISLFVGFIATTISTFIGIIIGSVSGYFGGFVDNLLQRFTEIVRSFPFLPFIITLSAIFINRGISVEQRILMVMIILGLLGWTGLSRLLRGQILSIREQEFILAAKALGIRDVNIILRHIIPNVVSIIIVSATLSFAGNILVESGLSFLGFGVQEPGASWGLILRQGTRNSQVIREYPWTWFFPGIFILLTVLSVNFIGDGLRDAIDPKNNAR